MYALIGITALIIFVLGLCIMAFGVEDREGQVVCIGLLLFILSAAVLVIHP